MLASNLDSTSRPNILRWGLFSGCGVFIFCMALVWQGIDLFDEGLHLTNQSIIFAQSGVPACVFSWLVWLTDFLAGCYLWLGDFGLLGARTGWALTNAVTAVGSYWILSQTFDARTSGLTVFATAVLVHYHSGSMLIQYHTFPYLFLLGASALLWSAQSQSQWSARQSRNCAIAGALLGLGILARFPLIVSLGLPFVIPVVRYLRQRRAAHLWRGVVFAVAAAVSVLALSLAALFVTGLFEEFLSALNYKSKVDSYTVTGLGKGYLKYALWSGFWSAAYMLVYVGAYAALRWLGLPRARSLGLLCALVVPLYLGMDALGISIVRGYRFFLCGFCGWVWIFGFLRVRGARESHLTRGFDLLTIGLVGAVLICLGSNTGLYKMKYGLWLALPSSLMLLPVFAAGLRSTADGRNWRLIANRLVGGFACAMVVASLWIRFLNVKNDSSRRWDLVATVDHPKLRGIRTTPDRATRLKLVLDAIEERVDPGASILVYGSPLLHFLTNTKPYWGNPWPTNTDLTTDQALAEGIARLSKEPPALVVRAPNFPRRTPGAVEVIDRALANLGYRQVWSNGPDSLYAPSN